MLANLYTPQSTAKTPVSADAVIKRVNRRMKFLGIRLKTIRPGRARENHSYSKRTPVRCYAISAGADNCALTFEGLVSPVGTNRTNEAGLLMSVVRGRPEVTGRGSKRRE